DIAANDAIIAGVRTGDDSVLTQVAYDDLSRVLEVTNPAPFGNTVPSGQVNNRSEHVFEYGPNSSERHITGTPEPEGYLQKIEFDNLFRTTNSCDNTGTCTISEWDPAKD